MVNEYLETLKQLATCKDLATNLLVSLFQECIPDPMVIPFKIDPNCQIIRGRINNDGKFFTELKELSYPPQLTNNSNVNDDIPTGRISSNRYPMFYGVLIDEPREYAKPSMTMLSEIFPLLDNSQFSGAKIVTIGYWYNISQLNLYTLPFPQNSNYNDNTLVKRIREKWGQNRERFSPTEIEILEFIGTLMASKAEEDASIIYKITSAFNLYIFSKNPRIQGIVYPSVQNEMMNMCVAIKPEIVDTYLKCRMAKTFIYIQNGNIGGLMFAIANGNFDSDMNLQWTLENTLYE